MAQIIPSHAIVNLEEEPSFGNLPATPLSADWTPDFRSGSVAETLNRITTETVDGSRQGKKHQISTSDLAMTCQLEAGWYDVGRILKWGLGPMTVMDTTNYDHYRFVSAPHTTWTPKSFTTHIDVDVADHFATGEQRLAILGNVIQRGSVVYDGIGTDNLCLMTLETIAKGVLVNTTVEITVDSYAGLVSNTITFVLNGVTHTLTGVASGATTNQFNAATSNNTTATNIATAIDSDIAGLSATATTNTVAVTTQPGYNLTDARTSVALATAEVIRSTDNIIKGLPALRIKKPSQYNSANKRAFDWQGTIFQKDSGGYLPSHNHRSFTLSWENTLMGTRNNVGMAGERLLSGVTITRQAINVSFNKYAIDAAVDLYDSRNVVNRVIDSKWIHPTTRNTSNGKYTAIFSAKRWNATNAGDLAIWAGGDEAMDREIEGQAFVPETATTQTNTKTATTVTPALTDAFVDGASGEAAAFKWTADASDIVKRVRLKIKTDATGYTGTLQLQVFSSSANDPTTVLPGGISANTIPGSILSELEQAIYFDFDAGFERVNGTDYHFVLHGTGAGAGSVIVTCTQDGTETYRTTTDGGQTWTDPGAPADTNNVDFETYSNQDAMVIDLYTHTAAASIFADAS